MDELERVLIVEDDAAIRAAMVRAVAGPRVQIHEAASLAQARRHLETTRPSLIVLDVRLPDGSGVELAAIASRQRPKPTLVAVSGNSSAAEAFELGQAGVSVYLPKPFTLSQLREAVRDAVCWVPPLDPFVKGSVGKRELLDLVADVRSTMVDEALARSDGSRRGAAKQLGVSRQAVQQIVRKRDAGAPGPPDR